MKDEENLSNRSNKGDDYDDVSEESKSGSGSARGNSSVRNLKHVLGKCDSFVAKPGLSPKSSQPIADKYQANRYTPKGTGKIGSMSRMTEEKDDDFFKIQGEERTNGINTTTQK